MNSDNLKKQKGISLIELLVAMSVFIIISGAVSGILISGIKGQRHTLASQRLLDQTSFAMEYMSRALRLAKKGDDVCIGSNVHYEITNSGKGIKFINHLEQDDCQEFCLGNGLSCDTNGEQLMQVKNNPVGVLPLTSSKLKVDSLNFLLSGGSGPPDLLQPRVTISMRVQDKSQNQPSILVQTTVSQRNLDVAE